MTTRCVLAPDKVRKRRLQRGRTLVLAMRGTGQSGTGLTPREERLSASFRSAAVLVGELTHKYSTADGSLRAKPVTRHSERSNRRSCEPDHAMQRASWPGSRRSLRQILWGFSVVALDPYSMKGLGLDRRARQLTLG
jgi:hypothetical protein